MCALPVLSATQPLCAECLHTPLPLSATWVAVNYAFPWRDLLLRLKHQEPGLARPLAELWQGLQAPVDWLCETDQPAWILPIPTSPARMQTRGYNHSRSLALAWCKAQDLQRQLAPSAWLLRTQEPATQQGASRPLRFKQLRYAFTVPPQHAARIQGQRFLLIDDVMTTGATLSAAAMALHQAGAADVRALVLARTLPD